MVTLNTAIRAAQIQESTISGGHLASINSPTADYVLAFDSDQDKFKWVQSNEFVINEIPDGDVNGSNKVFTLSQTPLEHSEQVFLNGLLQERGSSDDYTITSGTITFNTAPEVGDIIMVSYLIHKSNKTTYSNVKYGYSCAGSDGYNPKNQIMRFEFPFDSGVASYVGTTSNPISVLGGCNSSLCGYIFYGGDWFSKRSSIYKMTFPFDSGVANKVGNCNNSMEMPAALNSSIHGFVGSTGLSIVERIAFPFDSGIASMVGNTYHYVGSSSSLNSTNYGYLNSQSVIDRFKFPFDSGVATYVGNMSSSRQRPAGCNSTNYGYYAGGYGAPSGPWVGVSWIDRIQFPFDSGTGVLVGNLSASRHDNGANNSTVYGYIMGGNYGSSYFSIIDRIVFPFNSGVAFHVGNLQYARNCMASIDGTDFVSMFI